MLTENADRPVHYPADPLKFSFDSEVSRIFDDMAARSIPNFRQAHDMHARMARTVHAGKEIRMLDIGASRGAFFRAMLRNGPAIRSCVLLDDSEPMCDHLRRDFPQSNVRVVCADICGHDEEASLILDFESFDVICCNYVLQFLPVDQQFRTLQRLLRALRPGGMFFLGHKEAQPRNELTSALEQEYIRFRLENGYSMEEINAKTAALKGSMFPMRHDLVLDTIGLHCEQIVETTRFAMFSTLAARKV